MATSGPGPRDDARGRWDKFRRRYQDDRRDFSLRRPNRENDTVHTANLEIGVPGGVALGSGDFLEFDFGGVAERIEDAGEGETRNQKSEIRREGGGQKGKSKPPPLHTPRGAPALCDEDEEGSGYSKVASMGCMEVTG